MIKSNGFFHIVDNEVHVIHISLVIITYTLKEYALSPTVSYEPHGINVKQGKSEGFDSWDRPSDLTQIGFESSIFQPV